MLMSRAAELSFKDVNFPPPVKPMTDEEKYEKKKQRNAIRKFCW